MQSFLNRLEFKVREVFTTFLMRLAASFNLPWLAAFGIYLRGFYINRTSGSRVLCMARSVFLDDIQALADFSGQCTYFVVPRNFFFMLLRHFSPADEIAKLTEDNYYNENLCVEGKKKYREFLTKMIPALRRLTGFKAVMSANFGYLELQEWAAACEQSGIPVIILFKEGMAISNNKESYMRRYKNRRLVGSKILFYNEDIKRAMLAFDIPGFSDAKSVVVGIPRLDSYFRLNREEVLPKKHIVLFSFYIADRLDYAALGEETLKRLQASADEFHTWVFSFASRHPDIKVVVKTKAHKRYLDYVSGIYKKKFPELLPNVLLTNGGKPYDLIKASYAILGFNSVSLFEAMAAGRPIVAPDFSDFFLNQGQDYFAFHPSLVTRARSEEELEKILLQISEQGNREETNNMLKDFVGFSDGNSSRRTEQTILELVR